MQAGSKKLLLASSVDGKELLFLSHRRRCKRKQLRLFLEVTGSIHLVTSCECMERRKCKCSLFSKYVRNLVSCEVASMYISTKIYQVIRKLTWLHGREALWVVRMEIGLNENVLDTNSIDTSKKGICFVI